MTVLLSAEGRQTPRSQGAPPRCLRFRCGERGATVDATAPTAATAGIPAKPVLAKAPCGLSFHPDRRIRRALHGRRDGGGTKIRLHRRRSGVGRLRARQPALGGRPPAGAAAGGGSAGALAEPGAGQLREADRRSGRQLVLSLGARRRLGGARDPDPPRAAPRRVERHQRTGLRSRPAARLRHLGAARQPRMGLRRRPADLPAHGALRARGGRVALAGRAAAGERGPGPERALRRPVPGRRGAWAAAEPRLQRIEPGRDLQDPGDHQPRPADEHRALLPAARPRAVESRQS